MNGPVSALVSLTCFQFGFLSAFWGTRETLLAVESIWSGASQGSGPCGINQIAPAPPFFVVSLFAVDNVVPLHTYIDGSGSVPDARGSIDVSLKVNGFLDANGNPIEATLLPEPGTLGMFGLPFFMPAGIRWKRKLFGLHRHDAASCAGRSAAD